MHCIYKIITGDLVSTTDDPSRIASPLPAGHASKQTVDPAPGYVWDKATLNFIAPAKSPVVAKYIFIQRLTVAERKALFNFDRGSSLSVAQQQNVQAFMRYLDFLDAVDLTDSAITLGVNYLETVALIGAGRAALVLEP